jgi:hypothetical protein
MCFTLSLSPSILMHPAFILERLATFHASLTYPAASMKVQIYSEPPINRPPLAADGIILQERLVRDFAKYKIESREMKRTPIIRNNLILLNSKQPFFAERSSATLERSYKYSTLRTPQPKLKCPDRMTKLAEPVNICFDWSGARKYWEALSSPCLLIQH